MTNRKALESHVHEIFIKVEKLKEAPRISEKVDRWLDEIFSSDTRGFREILITALAGKFLDMKFDPTSFYDCSPRGIYPIIWEQMTQRRIPCGKDGPLNVTKAISKINEGWVSGRRAKDRPAAEGVLNIFKLLAKANKQEVENIELSVYKRFSILGSQATSYMLNTSNLHDVRFLHELCFRLSENSAWAGAVPQKIVGLLLKVSAKVMSCNIEVMGEGQSAQATDAGSKKPGDIWEVNKTNGKVVHIYEITLRPVNLKRLTESSESVKNSRVESKDVTVLCRLKEVHPEVIKSLGKKTTLNIHGITYEIFDVYAWMLTMLERIGTSGRMEFYSELKSFVDKPITPRVVKDEWNYFHKD